MRKDMAKVIVARPRIVDSVRRRGRTRPDDLLPKGVGLRRDAMEHGGFKMLNENLAPLRRYLEKQAGRPWNHVYSEIAANLRPSSTVQQHVRDHLKDFVALNPEPVMRSIWCAERRRWIEGRGPWSQALYVDKQGVLRRTADLAWVKRWERERAASKAPQRPDGVVALSETVELRRIGGVWFEVRRAPLPEPEYRPVLRHVRRPRNPYSRSSDEVIVEVVVRQLVTPTVVDIVTGQPVAAGPELDQQDAWREYRKAVPTRTYAVFRRQLSRTELRRYGLENDAPAVL